MATEPGRRTFRLFWLTVGLLVGALVFGVLYVGVAAAGFVLLATASAVATAWSWRDEGRPGGRMGIAVLLSAVLVLVVVAAVAVARYT